MSDTEKHTCPWCIPGIDNCHCDPEEIKSYHQSRSHEKYRLESDSIVASCDCQCKSPEVKYHKPGCKYRLIRERDDARSERDQLSRDLSSLLASDCLDGHDAVEGARNGIAMRKAIKEAYAALKAWLKAGSGITTDFTKRSEAFRAG